MGRNPKPKGPFASIGKSLIALALLGGVVYGVAYGLSELNKLKMQDLADRAAPVSEVASKYIVNTPWAEVAGKLVTDNPEKDATARLAILADSHTSSENLKKALDLVKEMGIDKVVFLGDYSDWGNMNELQEAKKVMDGSELTYYSIPGDHDLAQSKGPQNFVNVFGNRFHSFLLNGDKFVLLDNSDNEKGVDEAQLNWFIDQLADADFVFASNPLYNTNGLNKLMGENNDSVKMQAQRLLSLIRNSSVKALFSGDNHLSGRYKDPEKKELEHIAIGALAETRNLQSPRFSILNLFDDGTYSLQELTID